MAGATGAAHLGAGPRERARRRGGHVASLTCLLARVLIDTLEARVLLDNGLRLYRLKVAGFGKSRSAGFFLAVSGKAGNPGQPGKELPRRLAERAR